MTTRQTAKRFGRASPGSGKLSRMAQGTASRLGNGDPAPEMKRELFASVEDMLAPEALSALLGTPIHDLRQVPFKTADALSGGHFLAIATNGGRGPRLVLKRFSFETDWVMRAVDDRQGRAARVWETGLLDRLPPEIVHGYRACARDGSGWAILMDDLSPFVIAAGEDPIGGEENASFLDAMASVHVAFWDQAEAADPALGFSRLEVDYLCLTPETGRREAAGTDPVPKLIIDGWDLLLSTVEPAIGDALTSLARDPGPLCRPLRAFPQTVVHADWKLGNLGLIPAANGRSRTRSSDRVVLLDWARVLAGPPANDLSWYLAVNCVRLPVSKEETIRCYRQRLESRLGRRLDERQWEAQLELCFLGSFLQLGWSKALGAVRGGNEEVRRRERAELDWWCEKVLPAIDRL